MLLLALMLASGAAANGPLAWPSQAAETRPWSYWWWLGSAVDPANLTRELERYRDAAMVGVHIIPIYGAKGYGSRWQSIVLRTFERKSASPRLDLVDHAIRRRAARGRLARDVSAGKS